MIHFLGGSLVTGACLWMGWCRCRWYGVHIRCLSRLCGDLARMEAELRERETDTPALLALLEAEGHCGAKLYGQCRRALEEGTETEFACLWRSALESAGLPLRGEERRVWAQVGEILGRYTGREQAVLLSGLRRELESFCRAAREEGRQQGRIAVVLGLSLGLMLALVLA